MPVSEERTARINKLEQIYKSGRDAYPSKALRTHTCLQCITQFDDLVDKHEEISVVGRIKAIRRHGSSLFLTIEDATSPLQAYVRKGDVVEDDFLTMKETIDLGDFIEVHGTLFRTRMGEKTVHASRTRLLSKALLPLPEKWHGLSDVEVRYRKRYLDLIANTSIRDIFHKRTLLMSAIRKFFDARMFQEVETPILQPLAGGATARPFTTHHNALDQDMFLRIAPELYLKRLIVGGYERVYEVARCFRNEGIDHSHNPEFTMLEAYMAYADYLDLMDLMEELFRELVRALFHEDAFTYEDHTISMREPFGRLDYFQTLTQASDIPIDILHKEHELRVECGKRSIHLNDTTSLAQMLDELTKKYVLPLLIQPTFLMDHPVVLSPLSKRKITNPEQVERFQLIMAGKELVNAFSELNDPLDQASRFEEQDTRRRSGDEEAHRIDHDFITALEHGMPPTAGLGIGIDRLVAILTNSHSVKEVILFPTLRNQD
ncbi:lysine--tRNA ligase [Candidatus Uhrbacteria bacterium]|nr:lysine--tRNA ligase [Candidatus Uhrbacteria bacterium]